MIEPATPDNETERLQALDEYAILDTLPEQEYDDITRLASQICQTPISLISLIDENRQWFKSRVGLAATETPRELAFCAHAINDPHNILAVPDSRLDERFNDNPLVTGDPHVIFYTGVPLVSRDGYSFGTLCVIDSKPKQLSEEQFLSLRALSNQIVKLLELRKANIQLKKAMSDLEFRNEELGRFAHVAAHDIKSPLSNIIMATELLKEADEDEADEITQHIKSSSLKLRDLVDGILAHSKSEKLLYEKKEKFAINDLIEETIRLVDTARDHQFIFSEDSGIITANRVALQQILINLFSNSIKYNDNEKAVIEIELSVTKKFNEFRIKDNGLGIQKTDLEKIFEIFEVTSNKDRFGRQGSGIGLSTVKKLIEGMGGEFHVESEVGKGTLFEFTILK